MSLSSTKVQEIMNTINTTCRSRGGTYKEYSCKTVSWDDVSRSSSSGGLSCWGANITDTYLKAKNGTSLFTVRPNNWNEKLGTVSSSDVAVVVGNTNTAHGSTKLEPKTLRDVLTDIGSYGEYANLAMYVDLSDKSLDTKVSIRFQTTFIPVDGVRGKLEFATEAYNYNTHSDSDPKNLVLLCTAQGLAVQQDGRGTKKIFHHTVDSHGKIKRHWLEAERSLHRVGGPQIETKQEKADAIKRGKATASVIGIKAMGTRFNVLMTVQVPLKQKPKPRFRESVFYLGGSDSMDVCACDWCDSDSCDDDCGDIGTSKAARVSKGSVFDTWSGLDITEPSRHPSEHVTVTCVIYNTITGGVPSETDVLAAIDDMENLYLACGQGKSGNLADKTFDFMKDDKFANTTLMVPSQEVQNFDVFPSDSSCSSCSKQIEHTKMSDNKGEATNTNKGEAAAKKTQNVEEVKIATPASGLHALTVGDRIEARYVGNKKYYAGKISSVNEDGTYNVSYNDGDQENNVAIDMIRTLAPLGGFAVGDKVRARYKGRRKYWDGQIAAVNGNNTYTIKYNDGDQEKNVGESLIRGVAFSSTP